ncbi:ClpX C4-type zinc finger protein [Streptomyces sp. NPDC052109]|uniref:ClpX C4-type zinc finger protein n=1 Tax=Streptomyces sp. NPDC052109 TaxID=3155527 RepID=UPI003420B972
MTTEVLPFCGCRHSVTGQTIWPETKRCTRQRTNGVQCKAKRTIWPTAHVEAPDPESCWKHMSQEEQRECNRGRARCLETEPQCAVCHKGWEQVARLIAANGGIFICDDCLKP